MNLNFLEAGDGPPVVILHGLFGQARNWAGVAKLLADRYRVVSVDVPNHGRSPWTDVVNYPVMADAVRAFLADKGLTGAAMVGHSMGGKVAMTLALNEPSAIGDLAVVDIAPVPYDHDTGDYLAAMRALPLADVKSRDNADELLSGAVRDPAVRQLLLQNLARGENGYEWRINLDGLHTGLAALHGFPDGLREAAFKGRTLFVAGAKSNYIDGNGRAEIRRLFPTADIAVIDGAGHWVHADKPAETAAALQRFLATRS